MRIPISEIVVSFMVLVFRLVIVLLCSVSYTHLTLPTIRLV